MFIVQCGWFKNELLFFVLHHCLLPQYGFGPYVVLCTNIHDQNKFLRYEKTLLNSMYQTSKFTF